MSSHLYLVAYDISSAKRWRQVYRVMNGFGEWLQLSVFQCRLSRQRKAELISELTPIIQIGKDHVILIDLGDADGVAPKVTSIGKPYTKVDVGPTIC